MDRLAYVQCTYEIPKAVPPIRCRFPHLLSLPLAHLENSTIAV